jgi:hypothetical protein
MSISDDVDADSIINRLAGPLSPPDRDAFRRAAEAVLAQIPCLGEGAIYRALVPLQRAHFNAPSDTRVAHAGARPFRGGKLTAAAPIGRDDPRVGGHARRRLKLVG